MYQRNGITPRISGIIGGIVLLIGFLAPFTIGSSENLQQLFQSAEDLYGQADYEGALVKYTAALEESMKEGVDTQIIDKDFTTLVHYKIAVVYSRLAQQSGDISHYKTAIDHIEKAALTASVPKYKEALTYLWGATLYQTEQFKLAELKFKQLIENFPNSLFVENTWYMIGKSNYKLQDYEDSRQAFKTLLNDFLSFDLRDDAQYLIAQSFLNELNYEQAYQEFDKIETEEFRSHPNLQAEAMYKAAYSLNQLSRDNEAIKRYTNFIKQFPDSPYVTAAYFDQGVIYARQKNYQNARTNYEIALQNAVDQALQAEIQSAIGRTYFEQGAYKNALVSYNVLLEKYPDSNFIAEARLGIANSHFRLENWDEAIVAYKQVINEYEYSLYAIDAYYGLSLVYRDTNRWTLLLEIADEANKKYATSNDDHVLEMLTNIASLRDIAIKNIKQETVE